MRKFNVRYSWVDIVPVEVDSETDKTVIIEGRRHDKRSDYEAYFDTFSEAKEHLIDRKKRKQDNCAARLDAATEELERAETLEEDAE